MPAGTSIVRRAVLPVLCASLGACVAVDPRVPLPAAFLDTARIDGFDQIRVWGDEVSPGINAIVEKQFRQIRQAVAPRGDDPRLKQVDFLAISGGGGDGAYGAGVLKGWSDLGTRKTFEVVTGVSTGALSAPFAFLGPAYDGALQEIYTKYGDADLYADKGLLGLAGSSLKDTAPLKKLVLRYVTEAMLDEIAVQYRLGRRLLVQTTNLDAQRPVIWDLSAVAASGRPNRRDLFIQVLMASCAIPAIFPPVRIKVAAADGQFYDEMHVDGGVTSEIFFAPPQLKLGRFESSIFGKTRRRTLYAILNGKLRPEYKPVDEQTIPIATRSLSTMIKYQGLGNLGTLDRGARKNGARLFYTAIPEVLSAVAKSEFDTDYMRKLYQLGREVGRSGKWSVEPPATPVLYQVPAGG